VNYRKDADAAKETVAAIESGGGSARAYAAAVEDYEAAAAMVDSVVNDFGFVDILVHNAGIASRGKSVADTDVEELERLVRVHALSAHQLARHVLPSMRTRERGDIVMISSVATSHYAANGAPYNMGKAALEALAFGLAKEERDNGIHVNVVAPGLVETEMGRRLVKAGGVEDIKTLAPYSGFGRVCQPEDVAAVVVFCCSPAAGYMTGQRLEVDGGGPKTPLR